MKITRLLKILLTLLQQRLYRFVLFRKPWQQQNPQRGIALRTAFEKLGPLFVKFGQILSVRRDFLPDDIVDELEKLQDQVPAFPGHQAVEILEKVYKKPISKVFAEFDQTPLASASVAQVHTAKLHSGDDVVVKILRPGIKKIIKRDIALLYQLAKWVSWVWKDAARLRLSEVIAEFEHSIANELDLMIEAGNASQLRRNFTNSPLIYVPEVYWEYSHAQVMVMERIYGMRVSDMDALNAQQVDLKKLAERGVEIFFTQVFRDRFFHADMHPGNIFVANHKPNNPQYIAVDFGIMGSLNEEDQRYLAEILLAFFNRAYYQVALLHVKSGWVPKETRVEQFEASIRAACEPIFSKPLKDISFAKLLLRLFQTAKRFDMQVQPQLLLLQKTLMNVECLGRQLYPELDLWSTAKPFLERWLKSQFGFGQLFSKLQQTVPLLLSKLPEVSELVYELLRSTQYSAKK
jgi:ubiquinone biosynthesis protein